MKTETLSTLAEVQRKQKRDTHTNVEVANEKERLLDRWCVSMGVEEEFKKLRE